MKGDGEEDSIDSWPWTREKDVFVCEDETCECEAYHNRVVGVFASSGLFIGLALHVWGTVRGVLGGRQGWKRNRSLLVIVVVVVVVAPSRAW